MNKKILAAIIIGITAIVISSGYIIKNFSTKEEAVQFMIHKDLPDLKKENYQLVIIPGSRYVLCITDIPHSIYIYKAASIFNVNFASMSGAEHLYAGDGKTMHYLNEKLIYGFDKDRPVGKEIFIDNKKMKTVELNQYFSKSKYKMNYKNLVFYYPEKPIETLKNNLGFTEIQYH